MNVVRLHGIGDLRLHEEQDPQAGDGEVLLRVTAVGLCGSDRHWFAEGAIGDAVLVRPLVLGHEFVARIESGPRAGERVAVDPAIPCERCAVCRAGEQHLCAHGRFAGHGQTDGALRSLLAWPEGLVHPIPDGLADVDAALLEPLGVALHALDLGPVGPGAAAGVVGCGPIGLLLVQLLRLAGATTVVATDPLPHRAEAALALGATHVSSALEPGFHDRLDVVFEASGADDGLDDALLATRPAGRTVLVGIPVGDRSRFTASVARRKELTLLPSRRMRATDLPRAIALVEAGRISLTGLVSQRHALEAGGEAWDALTDRRGLKVVVEPQRTAEPQREPERGAAA
jgi:L-iditol 2-dehydrogenase